MERSPDDNTTQKKETRKTFKKSHTGLLVYFPTSTNRSHGYYKKRMEKVLDENQPREQAGFRNGYSTVDHLQTINQMIVIQTVRLTVPGHNCGLIRFYRRSKIYIDFKRPLCIGYISYKKAFDSMEHEAIFMALRSIGIYCYSRRYLHRSYYKSTYI